ncbi:MAG: acetoin utilization protein AcuC [Coriobacteriia bacterium]|nr:acetoin utilization protein AcuC [Coriobacteriia bacterium]
MPGASHAESAARPRAALVYSPAMTRYRFGPGHPMLPERFSLAVDLMRAWDLIGDGATQAVALEPAPATDADLLRVHSAAYLTAVRSPGLGEAQDESFGIGDGDTPRFANMHEVSALVAGGSIKAVDAVLDGTAMRAFNPAGGLHHAHRDRAAGFCVYNDCAVAIEHAIASQPGARVAYVDIDAHHGDGVEEAFAERRDVLTISVHESGQYLYPGTGSSRDIGRGDGEGFALNVPLPPSAGPDAYGRALERVIRPALRAFAPDIIVAQLGADSHRSDPLTHLGQTVAGHHDLVRALVSIADEFCEGRLVALGGGGYEAFSATPRMWACAMAALIGVQPPDQVPADWLAEVERAATALGITPVLLEGTFDEVAVPAPELADAEVARLVEFAIRQTVAASPLLS